MVYFVQAIGPVLVQSMGEFVWAELYVFTTGKLVLDVFLLRTRFIAYTPLCGRSWELLWLQNLQK